MNWWRDKHPWRCFCNVCIERLAYCAVLAALPIVVLIFTYANF